MVKTKTSAQKIPMSIKKGDLIADIVKNHPESIESLSEYGLHCINCPLNQFETIEIGAKFHGIKDEEIEKMIDEINSELLKKKK